MKQILGQQTKYTSSITDEIKAVKSIIAKEKSVQYDQLITLIKERSTEAVSKNLELISQKGASAWLTCLPLEEHNFTLNKQEFRDAMYLRYQKAIADIPRYCSCGERNSIDHV